MNRTTLAMLLFVAAAAVVGAQTPPTPARPVRPAEPTRPTPAARPEYAPLPARWPDADEIRVRVDEAARMSREIAREMSQIDREAIREQSQRAAEIAREVSREASRFSNEHAREMADAAREVAREASRMSSEQAREIAQAAREQAQMAREFNYNFNFDFQPTPRPAIAPMTPLAPMAPMGPMSFNYSNGEFRTHLPVFYQGTPEDSLYQLAHEFLGRGEYGRAAQLFREIGQKYPNSNYKNDLPYWEAFARFRIGTTEELKTAAKLLEPRASKLIGVVSPSTSNSYNGYNARRGTNDSDVAGLYTRINGVLAQRGDRGAADIVAKAAQSGVKTCDRDEMGLRTEAMASFSRMDPAGALPLLKGIVANKDECAVDLRRRAVFILGNRGDAEAASLLAAAAKSDPSPEVRAEAIAWLPKLQGDAGVTALEDLLRTEQDERIQKSVVRTLVASDNQRARTSMRALIDRKDAPVGLRVEAIGSFNSERATTDDAAYLRSLYGRADNDRVKQEVVNAVGRIGGQENDQWLLALAKNTNEPSQFRATAISRLMRSNISIADLSKLYDASESLDIRQRIVSSLEGRKEPEAADKLFDIFKNSTVPSIRSQAINALIRRKDPRSLEILKNISEGKQP